MLRASWSSFLHLSLVSCPIYFLPTTTRTKSIRLHQVWEATPANETDGVRVTAADVRVSLRADPVDKSPCIPTRHGIDPTNCLGSGDLATQPVRPLGSCSPVLSRSPDTNNVGQRFLSAL
jgi:hypothetical protein